MSPWTPLGINRGTCLVSFAHLAIALEGKELQKWVNDLQWSLSPGSLYPSPL